MVRLGAKKPYDWNRLRRTICAARRSHQRVRYDMRQYEH